MDSHPDEDQKRNPPRQRKPITIRIFRALKRQYHHARGYGKKGETEHQRNEKTMARWTRRLGLFTIILAFIAAITAGILYITDQTLRKTLLIGQRAFVHLEKISFGVVDKWSSESECNGQLCVYNLPRKVGRVVRTEFYFTNGGNTPTKALKIRIQCQPLGLGTTLVDVFDLFKRDDPRIIERSLGAKQTIPIAVDACEFKDDDTLLNAQMRTVRRLLLGEATYEDWIEPGKRHMTRFAHELVVRNPGDRKASPANDGLSGIVLSSDPIGNNNCTDEDCPE